MDFVNVDHFFLNKKSLSISEEAYTCGEYRSRTDDLLHAMQAL